MGFVEAVHWFSTFPRLKTSRADTSEQFDIHRALSVVI
jgi:hypothetical protein